MNRDEIIAKFRAHEAELRAAGVLRLSLVGSFARGDASEDSDVDVVVRLTDDPNRRGFRFYGRLEELTRKLEGIVSRPVDIITEPIHNERLKRRIAEDQTIAF